MVQYNAHMNTVFLCGSHDTNLPRNRPHRLPGSSQGNSPPARNQNHRQTRYHFHHRNRRRQNCKRYDSWPISSICADTEWPRCKQGKVEGRESLCSLQNLGGIGIAVKYFPLSVEVPLYVCDENSGRPHSPSCLKLLRTRSDSRPMALCSGNRLVEDFGLKTD